MSRLIDHLITDIRAHTENEEFSDSIGIDDEEFVGFLNDAQYRLHSLIVQNHSSIFLEEKVIQTVVRQQNYTLPSDIYIKNKVSGVEYSYNSDTKNYYFLKPITQRNRSNQEGTPINYIRQSGKILLSPIPLDTGAQIRVTYVRQISRIDKRRASVSSTTLDTSANTITALSFDVSTDTIDSTALNKYNFFSIVDKNGTIKMKDIPYDSYDTSTGVVTLTAGFVFEEGESIAVGDYVCSGKNSTTHSEFPEEIERYLIAYCTWKIFKRDSSVDSQEQTQELLEMERDIVAGYADPTDDIYEIPDINDDYDTHGRWSY
jgi:hypothetical protein